MAHLHTHLDKFLEISMFHEPRQSISANPLSSLQVVLKRRLNELVNEQVWKLYGNW
jgi:hypothetical protein